MPLGPGMPPPESQIALSAWNLMGGLDWQALPIVAEMIGVTDIETLVVQLVAIRDWQRDNPESD